MLKIKVNKNKKTVLLVIMLCLINIKLMALEYSFGNLYKDLSKLESRLFFEPFNDNNTSKKSKNITITIENYGTSPDLGFIKDYYYYQYIERLNDEFSNLSYYYSKPVDQKFLQAYKDYLFSKILLFVDDIDGLKNRNEEAKASLEQLIDIYPEEMPLYLSYSKTIINMLFYTSSEKDTEFIRKTIKSLNDRMLRADPSAIEPKFNRGVLYLFLPYSSGGNPKQGYKQMRSIYNKQDKGSYEQYLSTTWYAYANYRRKDFKRAEELVFEALNYTQFPQNIFALDTWETINKKVDTIAPNNYNQ